MNERYVWLFAAYLAAVVLFMGGAVTIRNDIKSSCDETGIVDLAGEQYTCAKVEDND